MATKTGRSDGGAEPVKHLTEVEGARRRPGASTVLLWCGPEVDFHGWGAFVLPELEDAGWVSPSRLSPRSARQVAQVNFEPGRTHNPLYLRHLERFELGSPYPEVIERVIRLLTRHPIRAHLDHTRLLAHRTGAMGSSS